MGGKNSGNANLNHQEKTMSNFAIWGLSLWIVALFEMGTLAAMPAVICSIIALVRIRKARGRLTGKWIAWPVSCLATIIIALQLALPCPAAILPILNEVREQALSIACATKLSGLSRDCLLYENYHKQFPQNLEQLEPEVESFRVINGRPACFFCRASGDFSEPSYEIVMVPSRESVYSSDPNFQRAIWIREKRANHRGRRMVLYTDGHIELIEEGKE
ncbi:MAG: DUF4190 domain-containing protein [Planctomycetota bacterium]|jgi:prepilin-type processing-associated H-X9-DG protein